MSDSFDLAKPGRKVHVGVVLMQGTTEILDVAPIDFFTGLSQKIHELPDTFFPAEYKRQALDIEFHWVNETGQTATLTAGLRVQPTDSFATCVPLDVVVMGAHDMAYQPNEKELEFIRKSYDSCSAFITICGGFMTALQAGLFKGKTVTAPEPMLEMMRQEHPDTKWVRKRWHRDGKLWTSGTLLNGLDLMRGFAEETFGKDETLAKLSLDVGCWPVRDVGYADVKV